MLVSLYISQKDVRDWVDTTILRKTLTENDIQTISLNTDKTNQVHVFSNYIAMLNEKKVTLYNSYGEKITDIDVNINNAIYDSSNKYMVVAENGGKELCLILDKTYLWSTTTDSDILQVHVNQNGYVAVVTTDITHKSIIILYNSEGKKLFTSYFSSTRIIDLSISDDNKYIAVGELDSAGTVIQSNIKIISIENAQKEPENTIIYTFNAEQGSLISNVEYQQNGQIICVYDDHVAAIKNEENQEILKAENKVYVSNELNNSVVYLEEQSEGVFKVSSNIHIINTLNNKDTTYELDDVVKDIYTNEEIIAVNAGTDIYFINTKGWLLKKYSANQEITNVKISENLAAIIYKDKIEIIDI